MEYVQIVTGPMQKAPQEELQEDFTAVSSVGQLIALSKSIGALQSRQLTSH